MLKKQLQSNISVCIVSKNVIRLFLVNWFNSHAMFRLKSVGFQNDVKSCTRSTCLSATFKIFSAYTYLWSQ